MSFEASYTWSKSIDIGSTDAKPGQGTPLIPTSLSANRGLSDFDVPHRFVASYVWALPTFKNSGALLRHTVGGWETTGILTLQSGTPFTIVSGQDNSRSGDGIDRANLVGNPYLDTGRPMDNSYSSTSTRPLSRRILWAHGALSSRNLLRGPGFANLDFGLMKRFAVTERAGAAIPGGSIQCAQSGELRESGRQPDLRQFRSDHERVVTAHHPVRAETQLLASVRGRITS